jgi:hypothetical protein
VVNLRARGWATSFGFTMLNGRRHSRYPNSGVTLVRVVTAALALFTGADAARYLAATAADPGRRRRRVDRHGVDCPPPGSLPLDT